MFIIRRETKSQGIIKALLSIALGIFMILTKANAMTMIVQVASACLLIAGIIPLLLKNKYPQMSAAASSAAYKIILAVLLFLLADPVAGIIRYVLGGIMCFLGISMIVSLLGIQGGARAVSFILPCLLILIGGLFFSEELIGKDIMGQIAGGAFVLYGISKGWTALKNNDKGPSSDIYEDNSVDEQ